MKTYGKNIFRTIRGSLSRFLAIFAIVALGVGFLAGLLVSPMDMRLSADALYDETRLYDLRVVSTLGLTEEDVEAVSAVEGVEGLFPAYDTDLVLLSEEGDSLTARVHSLPEDTSEENANYLTRPQLLEGRMPEEPGECVIVKTKSLVEGQEWVGATLTVEEDEEDEEEDSSPLPQTLTVVGTVRSAAYVSMEPEYTTAGSGTLEVMLYTLPETFDMDYYTALYLSVEGARELNSSGDQYWDKVEAVQTALEDMAPERAQLRYETLVGDAQKELDDARAEYEEARADTEEELADAKAQLEDAQKEIDENRQTLADAKAQLESGQAQLDSGKTTFYNEIYTARQEISNGYAQIESGQAQIDSGSAQIESAQAQLDQGYAQLAQEEQPLLEAKAQLDATKSQLDSLTQGKEALFQAAQGLGVEVADTSDAGALALIAQLEQAAPEAAAQFAPLQEGLNALAAQGQDTASALAAWEEGTAQYEAGYAQWSAGKAELDQNQAALNEQRYALQNQQVTLNNSKAELDQNSAALQQTINETEAQFQATQGEIDQGWIDYQEGMAQLEDAQKEVDEGLADYEEGWQEAQDQFAEAEEELADGESQLREIEEGEWYVFSREDNVGFSSYDSNADKIAAIASVFPVFFFLVAALVALTSMTRLVEEERQQIGTLKALGYSPAAIASKYMIYAAIATAAGCVVGVAAGMQVFPTIIINAYAIMYDIPHTLTPVNWPVAALASGAALVVTLVPTLNACWSALREAPARLMLPKAPKAGKRILLERITPLWKRMKFTHKVTARNLFRYKKRFFMTVIGIAGCTALLVTGFGVKDSISDIVELQFDQLNQYQLIVGLKDESALEGAKLQEILGDKDRVEDYLPVLQDSGQVVPKGSDPADSVTILAPSDVDRYREYFQFRDRTSGQPVDFTEDSVVITEKLSERQHLKVGDQITVKNQDEAEAAFTITGICENYVSHYLYLSPAAYEEAFGEAPSWNALLCKLPAQEDAQDEDQLTTDLLKCRDISGTQYTTELSRSFNDTISSINFIVVVLIVSAGILAFIVLYNLTNINIAERQNELATIKVLGFYNREVAAYIYRETVLLTLIGTAAGLVLGIFLHQFVIRTAEIDMVMFGRSIYPLSYVWSALLTVVFSVFVNLVMYRKLKNVDMVESLKAPE